jgi:DNA polymerase II small subunit/DNA polymerase delta subunit B
MGNPARFQINDITFGVINADVIKDMCINMITKGTDTKKIECVLESILQQRSYYPLYPGNSKHPIEHEQFEKMMFETPDVLITPSELMLFAKVSL